MFVHWHASVTGRETGSWWNELGRSHGTIACLFSSKLTVESLPCRGVNRQEQTYIRGVRRPFIIYHRSVNYTRQLQQD